jgi:adenylosuccinate lyase
MSVEVPDLYYQRPESFDPLANHPDPEKLYFDSLMQASLLAGREKPMNWEIDEFLSEGALHRYRGLVDIEAMINLSEAGPFDIPISTEEKATLRGLYQPDAFDSKTVLRIDHLGYKGAGPLEHDVRAVEVYLCERLDEVGLSHLKPWLHFGETSEDTNNLAQNLMLRDVVNRVVLPSVSRVADRLAFLSASYADVPLVGITHAQDGSPQTVGKRLGKSLYGTTKVIEELKAIQLTGKFGGAVGNHNPLYVIEPDFDWDSYSRNFVESFGFEYSSIEDQRNNHLAVTQLLNAAGRVALVTHQNVLNAWLEIRDNVLVQKHVKGESGSSTMSHKINPWRLENSEPLFEQSRRLIQGAEEGLVHSRDERDLSDHGWQRAYGDMFGRIVAGLNYVTMQLDRLEIDEARARATFSGTAEILSELLQTARRSQGDADAYDTVRLATQGKSLRLEEMRAIIDDVLDDGETKDRVMAITPEKYIGNAPNKAREAVIGWHACKTAIKTGILDWRLGIDGALFDLDDTLVLGDKVEMAARMSAIAEDLQADISPEELTDILKINGWSATTEGFVKFHNDKHPDQLITLEQFTKSNDAFSGSFNHLLSLANDVDTLLDNLDRFGMKKAIVTQRGPKSLPKVLAQFGLDKRFDNVVHGKEAPHIKPYPHSLAIGLAKLGIKGHRAMMIGDLQTNDIIPAKALGVKAILVSKNELDPLGAVPDMHVKDLRELALKFER